MVSPLINLTGIGVQGGTRDQMLAAVKKAKAAGKGIYAMKPLGGGHLISRQQAAFQFLLEQEDLDAIAVGMKSEQELRRNLAYFNGEAITEGLAEHDERQLHFEDWCLLCGRCVSACPSRALSETPNQIVVDQNKCVFCGYCGAACPEFAIKVI